MDTRREVLRSQRVCRFCLTRDEPLTSIYERSAKTQHTVPLPLQIMACVAIEAFPSDGMPVTICQICCHFMDQSYRFKQICRQADEALRHFISNGDLRGPIEWPHDMLKSLPPDKIKIEELDFTDDENEELEQMEDEEQRVRWLKRKSKSHASSTPSKIKVVQRGNEIIIQTEEENAEAADTTKESSDKETEMEMSVGKGDEKVVPTFSFPCDMCERSFPLKQLLEIHLQKSHRERTFQCGVCPNKFFSKYDLQKHLHIHSGEKPYECVVCQKKFARHAMLRRHEKVHSEVPLLMCSQCDSTFFSAEELDAHMVIHQKSRPYKCSRCPKSFTFKQGLLRHESVHMDQHDHKCNYCPKSFRTINMLGRHVQAHAGRRPYPCKYCNRSFLLPHHYTRHLRISHNDESWRNKASAPKGNSSFEPHLIFKCEQCEKTFEKQDELIFHSAIHATENLTCPLCKDKFENVDDVTQHITSHAEGSYVCDWCDLMFNSEARLDSHVDEAHGESLRETSGDADDDELCIEGRVVDDEVELQMLRENFGEEGEEDDDYDEGEDYNEYDIKITADDDAECQTLEITPQVKREMDVEFRQQGVANLSSENVDKAAVEDNEDNVIYTELETVDTMKLAQQRQQEQLETDHGERKSSSILRKAEEIKKQKIAVEENIQRKIQAKIPQTHNKEAAVLKRIPEIPERQLSPPKKPLQKPMMDSPRRTPMPVPKMNMSGTKSVMQALQRNEEYRALKNNEKRQFESDDSMAEIKPIKTPVPVEPVRKLSSEQKNTDERTRKEIETDPNIKSSERSLKMLEKDLQDLKKGVKQSLGSSDVRYERFPSRSFKQHSENEHRFSKDDAEESQKSVVKNKELGDGPAIPHQQSSRSPEIEQIEREKRREERRKLRKEMELKMKEKIKTSVDDSEDTAPERISERRHPSADDPNIRRSGRPSKIKDYAKMLKDSTGLSSGDSEFDDMRSDSDSDGPDYKVPTYIKDNLKNSTPSTGRSERRIAASTPIPKTPDNKVAVDKNGAVSTIKRGRGRPRKNPILASPTPTSDEQKPVSDELVKDESQTNVESEVKDGVPIEKTTEDQPENQSTDSQPVEKKRSRVPVRGRLGYQQMHDRRPLSGRQPFMKTLTMMAQGNVAKRGRGRPSKKALIVRKKIEAHLRKAQRQEFRMQTSTQPERKQFQDDLQESYEELEDVPRKDVPAKRGRKSKPKPELTADDSQSPAKGVGKEVSDQKALLDETQRTISEIKRTLADTDKITAGINSDKMRGPIKKIITMERPTHSTIISKGDKLISPTGQKLIKVPASVIKSLPPGVKPLPLPPYIAKPRTTTLLSGEVLKTVNAGDVEKMVRGEKKVRKFLMTKAEVEAMTKKGLLEIKDGALVVKAGYKLPMTQSITSTPLPATLSTTAQKTTPQPLRVEPIKEAAPSQPVRAEPAEDASPSQPMRMESIEKTAPSQPMRMESIEDTTPTIEEPPQPETEATSKEPQTEPAEQEKSTVSSEEPKETQEDTVAKEP